MALDFSKESAGSVSSVDSSSTEQGVQKEGSPFANHGELRCSSLHVYRHLMDVSGLALQMRRVNVISSLGSFLAPVGYRE